MMVTLPALWLSDPAWLAMDATARGWHTQLVLLAAQQGGELTADEGQWRRWLGIPEAGNQPVLPAIPAAALQWLNEAAPGRLTQLGGQSALLEYYWIRRWLPMLRAAWSPSREGHLTCACARLLAGQAPVPAEPSSPIAPTHPGASPTKTDKTTAKPRRAAKSAGGPVPAAAQLIGRKGLRPMAWPRGQGLGPKLIDRDRLLSLWRSPADRGTRLNLWSVGLAVLASAGTEANNRSFLSSLIQQFGERRVASAVGELAGRGVPPADPRSFLRSLLRRDTQGTEAAQKARDLRASIPL